MLAQVRPKLAEVGIELAEVGPELAQVSPKLYPTHPKLGPSWVQVVASCLRDCMKAHMSKGYKNMMEHSDFQFLLRRNGLKTAHANTKWALRWPKMGTS